MSTYYFFIIFGGLGLMTIIISTATVIFEKSHFDGAAFKGAITTFGKRLSDQTKRLSQAGMTISTSFTGGKQSSSSENATATKGEVSRGDDHKSTNFGGKSGQIVPEPSPPAEEDVGNQGAAIGDV